MFSFHFSFSLIIKFKTRKSFFLRKIRKRCGILTQKKKSEICTKTEERISKHITFTLKPR